MFGLYDGSLLPTALIDPKYLNVAIVQLLFDNGYVTFDENISISVDLFTEENFPQEFEDDIFDEVFIQESVLYSSKDLNKLVLMNGKYSNSSKNIGIIVGPCN